MLGSARNLLLAACFGFSGVASWRTFGGNAPMRPAVSMSFCLPVKKGWQAEAKFLRRCRPCGWMGVTNGVPTGQCTGSTLYVRDGCFHVNS